MRPPALISCRHGARKTPNVGGPEPHTHGVFFLLLHVAGSKGNKERARERERERDLVVELEEFFILLLFFCSQSESTCGAYIYVDCFLRGWLMIGLEAKKSRRSSERGEAGGGASLPMICKDDDVWCSVGHCCARVCVRARKKSSRAACCCVRVCVCVRASSARARAENVSQKKPHSQRHKSLYLGGGGARRSTECVRVGKARACAATAGDVRCVMCLFELQQKKDGKQHEGARVARGSSSSSGGGSHTGL